jgi:soluble lytic murein transglycosylase-like protein
MAAAILGIAVFLNLASKSRDTAIEPIYRSQAQTAVRPQLQAAGNGLIATAQAQEVVSITDKPVQPEPTPGFYKKYVEAEAKLYGVNPETADFIVEHESRFDPAAIGDSSSSFGMWQINLPSHPEITQTEALDYRWSTEWAMTQIIAGRVNQWSTWRHRDDWYN